MLAELLTGSELDFRSHEEKVPIVGAQRGAPRLLPGGGRLVKTHEPYRSAYGRAIYLVRDVRDVALSLYKIRIVYGFDDGTFDEFLTSFIRGHIAGYGSWQAHVDSWFRAAEARSSVLIIHYEDLVDDTVAKLAEMVGFLGVPVDDARLREVVVNNRPARMRNRPTKFSEARMSLTVGRGTHGNWRTAYSEAQLGLLEPAMGAMRRAGYVVDNVAGRDAQRV